MQHVDHSTHSLGKAPPRHDPRTLRLEDYLTHHLPTPPLSLDWGQHITSWPMLGNDRIGNCAYASAGHEIQVWTANAGKPSVPTEAEIIKAYSDGTGYDPARPETDKGTVLLDMLKQWRNVGIAGHKIGGFVSIEPRNHDHLRIAMDLFGGVLTGFALPKSAQRQRVWSVQSSGLDARYGSWGGHAVPLTRYAPHQLACVTWAAEKSMTWGFVDAYCDEVYAVFSEDWINQKGLSPPGFNAQALLDDLKLLA